MKDQSAIIHQPKTILVTGGAGYIGSFVTRELIRNGYEVIIFDNLENGHIESIDKEAIFIKGNLSVTKNIKDVFDKYKIDAVIDLAAYLMVGESMEKPKEYIKNNVFNLINLLEVMESYDCKYIIKSSTAAVYGSPKDDYIPILENYTEIYSPKTAELLKGKVNGKEAEGEAFFQKLVDLYNDYIQAHFAFLSLNGDELNQLRIPTNVYGWTKSLDEIILKKYDDVSGIKSIKLRYFNVAGAEPDGNIGEDHPVESHLVPLVIKNAINGSKLQIMGNDYETKDGTGVRDYLHVIDLANGHAKALQYLLENCISDTFNLGNGDGYSVLEVANTVEQQTGLEIEYDVSPRRQGDPKILIADSNKAQNILKWKAKYKLSDMISSAYNWHKIHPNGYNDKDHC